MADTARALFDGKSDAILSNPEMIRDLLQQGCRQTSDVPSQWTGAESCTGASREREPLIGSIPEPTINCAWVVVRR
jgi:hypothetical protein